MDYTKPTGCQIALLHLRLPHVAMPLPPIWQGPAVGDSYLNTARATADAASLSVLTCMNPHFLQGGAGVIRGPAAGGRSQGHSTTARGKRDKKQSII